MRKVSKVRGFGSVAKIGLVPAAALALALMPQGGAAQPKPPVKHLAQNGTYAPVRDYSPGETAAHRALEAEIRAIAQGFNGDIGIAVEDVQSGWTAAYDGDTYFPQQSVSKFWVALTALNKADQGALSLGAPVTLHRDDITLFHQPIAAQIRGDGYTTTVGELMTRALQQSDNTCNDFVLWQAGGPEAVRAFLHDKGINGIRFGPGERLLQSAIAGITWKQAYATNGGFYRARDALPAASRRAAFERYIASPMDGAMPLGVVDALSRLKRGELLSPASTQRLLGIMSHTKTGPQRLKGGLEPGWTLSHKTGTGQVLGGVQAGYNDIGVITGPDGHSYAMAVMIRRTSAPLEQRMRAMQNVVHAVISYHDTLERSGDFAGYTGGGRGGRR
ncbi:MAG: beta-lactamase class [Sphingomonadales bacterium]|nr:beta-lactamase class [Sphingomonadales bacterium]